MAVAMLCIAGGVYMLGYSDGQSGRERGNPKMAFAAEGEAAVVPQQQTSSNPGKAWSPTKPYPTQEAYYPGTEALKPDEMRVTACGSGMPMPRVKQAAASFLIELGNGDKFIFDPGTGSFTTLYALGIPLDYLTRIFNQSSACRPHG